MVTVLHLGKSSLPKKPITDDDVDRISLCLKVLSECSPLMNDIFNKECRKSLSHMLTVRLEEEKLSQKVKAVIQAAKNAGPSPNGAAASSLSNRASPSDRRRSRRSGTSPCRPTTRSPSCS